MAIAATGDNLNVYVEIGESSLYICPVDVTMETMTHFINYRSFQFHRHYQ